MHAGKLIICDAKRLTVLNMKAQTIHKINSNLNKLGNVELEFELRYCHWIFN
jgi:hypothetical protein